MPDDKASYLADLLERIDSRERLPGVEQVRSSNDTVAGRAALEVSQLSDVDLVPAIRERVRTAKRTREFEKLSSILGCLIHNTHNAEALVTFEYLLTRAPASDSVWMYLLQSARRNRVDAAMPHALKNIREPFKQGLAMVAGIEYLGTMGGVEAIPIIGSLLDTDCDGRCDPMYCVFALREIDHTDALPYLQRAIERHSKSRKRVFAGVYSYSKHAIESITHAPPPQINGMAVCAWTIPPDLPERIAVCESGDSFAVMTCDAAWNPDATHIAGTQKEATEYAKTLAGGKVLNWHQIPFQP